MILTNDSIEDFLKGAPAEAALLPGFNIIFVPVAQPLRAKIIGISERLMKGLQVVSAG